MYVGRYVLPWPCPDDILIKSLKKYRHLQLSSFLSSLDLLITIIRYHHDHCQHNKPDSYKARTLETRISTQMIDIQWSSGLHPRNLGRAKDAREVGIDSFRFLQRTQTCTLDLLGRFIYIYILYSQIQFPLVARNKLTFEQESYCCQLIEDEPCRLTVVPAD